MDRGLPVDPRSRPRRRRTWPFAAVLCGALAGLAIVAADRFRLGSAVLAVSVLMGAALRAVLSERDAGMLVVRRRWVDVLVLAGLGGGLMLLTVLVPPPS